MEIKTTKLKYRGIMNIASGAIDITDPCYDDDTWCRMNNVKIKPGKYNCFTSALAGDAAKEHGEVIMTMVFAHEDVDPRKIKRLEYDLLGEVGVDAGLMSISESGVKPNYTDPEWFEVTDKFFRFKDELEEAMVSSELSINPPAGKESKQFWATSGFGDGEYRVLGAHTYDPDNSDAAPDVILIDFMM